VENSYPTIDHGRTRVDEMARCKHYDLWKTDFDLVQELGVNFLRYGPPLFSAWRGAGRYDWSFADETFADLLRRDVTPIVDLCHFGVPDWIGDFQNPDFPRLFADYARAFAARFPWVQFYTPVNEMYICALFSARYGWWNEQLASERGFVTALKHIVRANVLAMRAILDVRPDAIFVQSESSEYFHAWNPAAIGAAYRDLISEWRDVLPTQSVVLAVPAFPPSRQEDPLVAAIAAQAHGGDAPSSDSSQGKAPSVSPPSPNTNGKDGSASPPQPKQAVPAEPHR
jgi:hypothetical protein